MRVKICGITNWDEAKLCVDAGADALGFLVGITHLAEDKIAHKDAFEIIRKLPPFVSAVAVTHLTNPAEVIELCGYLKVSTVQIHNTMSAEDVSLIKNELPAIKIIKAFHVDKRLPVHDLIPYTGITDALLLDTRTEERLGGTGKTHDWEISSKITQEIDFPVILAGGLTPDNLKEALNKVKRLFGVDVNSGVETEGRKDKNKVRRFIESAEGFAG